MPNDATVRLATIFSTPLVTNVWAEASATNPLLRDGILAHEARGPGIGKSNHGGWHSETGQLEFCGDAGRNLIRYVRELVHEATSRVLKEHVAELQPLHWAFSAWANVNRDGDFNKIHAHPGSTWSGTYYVDAGTPAGHEGRAPLHLFDPCPGRNSSFLPELPSSVYVHPKPGLTVLFPSYVPHMVFPYAGPGTRISIAFNLRREPYP